MRTSVCVVKKSNLLCVLFVWAVFLLPASVLAGQPGSIETLQQTGKTFASIAEQASKAVVGVQAEKDVKRQQYWTIPDWPFEDFFGDEFFERFFRRQMPPGGSPQRKFRRKVQGSGFIISGDGYILTNNHLVGEAEKVTVKVSDEKQFEGKLIGADPDSDVAVVKIESDENLPFLQLADSDAIEVGEWVLAVGNPFGFSHSVTAGIISAKGRKGLGIATYEDFIQTDAAINPGNSGGPLLNLKGKVVGINTAIISRSGGNLGIGLAIPSNMARYIYEQLLEEGKVVRGYLGVTIQDLTPDLAESFELKDSKGVLVPEITEDSAADKGGIRKGDIIIELNGEPIENADELLNTVAMLEPGTKVKIVVLRDGKKKTLTVKLGTRPSQEQLAQGMRDESDAGKELGLEVQNLTDDLAQRLGYEDLSGVVIRSVKAGSLAALAGLKTGMLVMEVNRKEVHNVKDFARTLSKAKEKGSALLLINTGRFNRFVVLKFPEK